MNRHHRHRQGYGKISVGDLPVGSITAFAGIVGVPMPNTASPPDAAPPDTPYITSPIEAWGWMLCDGRTLQTNLYPELFTALGYLYGGSGGNFNIPDYRGSFLRGTDAGAGKDPDVSLRTDPAGSSTSNSGVGSQQTSAMLIHQHDYITVPAAVTPSSSGSTASGAPVKAITSTPVDAQDQLMTTTTGISAYETRPKNIYANYLIKFTYGAWHGNPVLA